MNIEIPETRYLTDTEKFIVGLRKLLAECKIQSYTYNGLGVISMNFADGSYIGVKRAFMETGYFPSLNNKLK